MIEAAEELGRWYEEKRLSAHKIYMETSRASEASLIQLRAGSLSHSPSVLEQQQQPPPPLSMGRAVWEPSWIGVDGQQGPPRCTTVDFVSRAVPAST